MSRVFLTALTLLTVVVFPSSAAERIAGGQPLADGRYPFAAQLFMPAITRPSTGMIYTSACSGALIAPEWIITAGHCFHDGDHQRIDGVPAYEIRVTVGRAKLWGPGGENARVVEVIQRGDTDLALARLDRRVRSVRPVGLSALTPRPGEVLRVVGFGLGVASAPGGAADRPERGRTGHVVVDSVDASTVFVRSGGPGPATSACPYDSGAPYFRETSGGRYHLVSTEIGGHDCPHDELESTARVDTVLDWIAIRTGVGAHRHGY